MAALALEPLVGRLRLLEVDHAPDGYPPVTMREISRLLDALRFYQVRCDQLQAHQQLMRDPERTAVCDILANGTLLPDPTGQRYRH